MSSSISPSGSSSSPSSASALITSTGIGSWFDGQRIVLADDRAWSCPNQPVDQLAQHAGFAGCRAYGTFTAALDTLKLALPALEDPSQLAAFAATVADKDIASATTSSDAVAGTYSLQVNNLATVATATSAALSGTAAVGTGTLTIQVGGSSTAITIDSSNNTLAGIAAAINSTPNAGVSASLITTTGAWLTAGADGNKYRPRQSGSRLPCPAAMAAWHRWRWQQVPAQDASYSINNFPATSASAIWSPMPSAA